MVFDVTAYTKQDVKDLLEGLNGVKDYILISSSAVYHNRSKRSRRLEEILSGEIMEVIKLKLKTIY